jgi:exodeoxyribonuclease VII large subunit
MAVPVRSELMVELSTLARRVMVCWQRGQEARRNELRAAARALPAAGELLAIPRQRLDGAAGALPRALKANTHAHFRRYAATSARLTVRVLRGQLAQANQRLATSGARMVHCARSLLRMRRDRYAGLEIRLKASKLSNSQAQRQRIARERERVLRLAERSRRALATAMQRHQARVAHSGKLLAALSYRGVLARGFALVRDEQGQPMHAAAAIGPGARLTLEFADGRVGATADTDRPVVARPAKPAASASKESKEPSRQAAPKRVAKPVDQGSLF